MLTRSETQFDGLIFRENDANCANCKFLEERIDALKRRTAELEAELAEERARRLLGDRPDSIGE